MFKVVHCCYGIEFIARNLVVDKKRKKISVDFNRILTQFAAFKTEKKANKVTLILCAVTFPT